MAILGDLIRSAESGGDNYAKNTNSSAFGPDQFLSGTWLDLVKSARPDIAAGKSDADLLALRSDPALSGEMRDLYAQRNGAALSAAGFEATPGNTYLAHFAGPGGAIKLLKSDPNIPVEAALGPKLGPEYIKANPFLSKMTAGDFISFANRKMTGAQQQPSQPPPPQAPVQAGPMSAASLPAFTSANLPLFSAPPPQAAAPQQQEQQQALNSLFEQMPATAPMQIGFMRRRPYQTKQEFFKRGRP